MIVQLLHHDWVTLGFNLKLTNMALQFADGSKKKALWKVVNVMIKATHLTFITDFFVIYIYIGGPTSSNHSRKILHENRSCNHQCS